MRHIQLFIMALTLFITPLSRAFDPLNPQIQGVTVLTKTNPAAIGTFTLNGSPIGGIPGAVTAIPPLTSSYIPVSDSTGTNLVNGPAFTVGGTNANFGGRVSAYLITITNSSTVPQFAIYYDGTTSNSWTVDNFGEAIFHANGGAFNFFGDIKGSATVSGNALLIGSNSRFNSTGSGIFSFFNGGFGNPARFTFGDPDASHPAIAPSGSGLEFQTADGSSSTFITKAWFTQSLVVGVASKSVDYGITTNDFSIIATVTGKTMTLPAASTTRSGQRFAIKSLGAAVSTTVALTGADTIDLVAASDVLGPNGSSTYQSDGVSNYSKF